MLESIRFQVGGRFIITEYLWAQVINSILYVVDFLFMEVQQIPYVTGFRFAVENWPWKMSSCLLLSLARRDYHVSSCDIVPFDGKYKSERIEFPNNGMHLAGGWMHYKCTVNASWLPASRRQRVTNLLSYIAFSHTLDANVWNYFKSKLMGAKFSISIFPCSNCKMIST